MKNFKRCVEKQIEEALETLGVVAVSGPKFCGETTAYILFTKNKYALDTLQKIRLFFRFMGSCTRTKFL